MTENIQNEQKEKKSDEAYCSACGAIIKKETEICPKCGVRVKAAPTNVGIKNAGLAAVLSVLFIGLGQIYNGQIGKGVAFFIIGFILALTMWILIGFILYPIFWIYNIYDAYNTANKINAGAMEG